METLKEKVFSRITADFQVMAKMVILQLDQTRLLFENNRQENIYAEIGHNERIIDSMDVKIRDEVINTIVLYSPRATNLRMIISYYDMTAYLERIGDLLLNISNFLKKTDIQGTLFSAYKNKLSNMLRLTKDMTQNAIFAFSCEDIRLAQETIDSDDQTDRIFHEIGEDLPSRCSGRPLSSQELTDALCISSMAYYIERIGDNATNIAEAAIYLIEGRNIKHASPRQEGGEATHEPV